MLARASIRKINSKVKEMRFNVVYLQLFGTISPKNIRVPSRIDDTPCPLGDAGFFGLFFSFSQHGVWVFLY